MCDYASRKCKCPPNQYGNVAAGETCKIAKCAQTTAGGVTYPGVNAGDTSTAPCQHGYKGLVKRTCVQKTTCGDTGCPDGTFPDNTFDDSGCTKLTCAVPTGIDPYNATYSSSGSINVDATATGTCSQARGYTGSIQRKCTQIGTGNEAVAILEPPSSFCIKIKCPAVLGVDINWPEIEPDGASREVQSTCNEGFLQAAGGPPRRTCQADGQWSAVTNPCTRVQCPAIAADDTTGRAGFSAVAWSDTPVAGTCPDHFDVSGGAPTRTCLRTGEWTDETSPCARIRCPALLPSDLEAGSAGYAAVDAPTTGVAGTCPDGWVGSPTRDCTLTGKTAAWTDAQPDECTRLECHALDDDKDASWPSALSGTTVEGTCNVGFLQSPKPRRACKLDGTWDTAITNGCQIATCPAGNYLDATWPKTFPGLLASGSCAQGYRPVGDDQPPQRQCYMNGTWDGEVTNPCSRRTCPALEEQFANWPETEAATATSGDMIVYGECIENYHGGPWRACTSSGEWSAILGSPCIPIDCDSATDCVLNCTARVEFSAEWPESPSFSTVNGTCVPGWAGHPQRQCGEYGAWQAPTAACTQLSCPPLNDGTAKWEATLSGSTAVEGRCALGYATARVNDGTDAGPPPMRDCTTNCNGTACEWAEAENPCLRLHCAALDSFQFAAFPETPSGTTANGTCLPGYKGAPSRVCNWDGQWDDVLSACTQINCPSSTTSSDFDVPSAQWATASAGSTNVVGTCKTLYGPVAPGVLPRRNCTLEGTWSATIEDACVHLTCPAVEDLERLVTFPLSLAGTIDVVGTCPPGYAGAPKRTCNDLGVWSGTSGTCVRRICPSDTDNADFHASWGNETLSNTTAIGTCQRGYAIGADGPPLRLCQLDGQWATDLVAGGCEQQFCSETREGNAVWPRTPAGDDVQVECDETYGGVVFRRCTFDGMWANISGSCTPLYCPASDVANNADYPVTRAGETAVGTCKPGLTGSPTRHCNKLAEWEAVENPCWREAKCGLNEEFKNAIWPETQAGATSIGECKPGFVSASVPRRECLRIEDGPDSAYGVWENDTIVDPCLYKPGRDTSDVQMDNLTVVAVTWNSVTLAWQAFDNGTQFFVSYAEDNSTFFASGAPVLAVPDAVFQKSDLAEFTEYQFRVVPAPPADRYGGWGVAVRTNIKPPANVRVTSYGDTAITLSWVPGSSFTKFVRIVYTLDVDRHGGIDGGSGGAGDDGGDVGDGDIGGGGTVRRDGGLPNNGTVPINGTVWHVAVNATNATTFRVEGLQPATSYLFRIYAGMEDGTLEDVGTTIPVLTSSTVDNLTSGPSAGALAGSVTGVLILLVAVVILGFLYHRRQLDKKQKELMAEYNAQVQMLTIPRTLNPVIDMNTFFDSDTLRRNALRANLNVPVTQFNGENMTLLNTVAEMSLPGYLLMDYSTALRPEARLVAGGAGTIFRATILDQNAIARSGTSECAVKVVEDWPSFTDEQNRDRFHHEVTVMWSLSFNANVIKLFGYCEEPRAIVTKLYPTDLFRYLHAQEDRNPLEPHLMLHLVSGIVNAIAAMHSLGVAHRDIKSPNVLMQEPQNGSVFPDPIICDFGISRTRYGRAYPHIHVHGVLSG